MGAQSEYLASCLTSFQPLKQKMAKVSAAGAQDLNTVITAEAVSAASRKPFKEKSVNDYSLEEMSQETSRRSSVSLVANPVRSSRSSSRGESPVAGQKPRVVPKKKAPLKAAPAGERATAAYDFSGEAADELTFKKGDTVYVTDKSDNDWWIGSLENGNSGSFPATY